MNFYKIEKMQAIFKEHKNKIEKYLCYSIFLILMILLHWNMSLDLSDDSVFKEVLKNETLIEHIVSLYMVENGKIFPDTLAAIFTYVNPLIWKILNIGILFIIVICIDHLFISSGKRIFSCLAILLFPFSLLTSAGYVATSVNYLWSTAALLVSLLPLKYAAQFKKRPMMYVVCFFAGLYAGNQEQAGAIVVTVYTFFILYSFFQKVKFHKYIWVQYILSILGVLFVFTAPGHIKRSTMYTIFNLPDFLTLDFFEKLIRGFTSTAAVIITGNTVIWPVFCFLLMLVVCYRNKEILIRLLSVIPLAGSLIFGNFRNLIFPENISRKFAYYVSWGFSMPDYRPIDASTYAKWYYYVPMAVSFIIVGIILLEIFWAFNTEKSGLIIFLTFSAGLCTRLIMGFSPTLYGSSFRTFIFLYLALGICIAILLDQLLLKKQKWKFILGLGVTFIYAVSTYIDSFQNIL